MFSAINHNLEEKSLREFDNSFQVGIQVHAERTDLDSWCKWEENSK